MESLALSDGESVACGSFASGIRDEIPPGLDIFPQDHTNLGVASSYRTARPEPIQERSEPVSPRADNSTSSHPGTSSALTAMILDSPPRGDDNQPLRKRHSTGQDSAPPAIKLSRQSSHEGDEQTPLIRTTPSRSNGPKDYGTSTAVDVENQYRLPTNVSDSRFGFSLAKKGRALYQSAFNPKTWNRHTMWENGVAYPASLLPAVLLGLLLNILDALSYGMILFPLGHPIFSRLGVDGISMFYVSTVVAQLIFSCGGSIFKGGIGSEMIEVVPFFHKMAFMILDRIGDKDPKAVLATTILSFAISSVLTGTVFFLMGTCGLGSLIGFFPRHILIGCIGGVGWFLVATGVEVSARLPGNLEYNLDTLRQLLQLDTIFLWTTPLVVAVGLLVLKRFVKSNLLVGGYFISVAVLFYVVKLSAKIPLDTLRSKGWVFDAPSSSDPWYHFYTLYGKMLLSSYKNST